jgi:hypothetical protein
LVNKILQEARDFGKPRLGGFFQTGGAWA